MDNICLFFGLRIDAIFGLISCFFGLGIFGAIFMSSKVIEAGHDPKGLLLIYVIIIIGTIWVFTPQNLWTCFNAR